MGAEAPLALGPRYHKAFHRTVWVQLIVAFMTQVGGLVSFPAYNLAIAFWALYSAHTRHPGAIATLVGLEAVSLVFDIAFCFIWRRVSNLVYLNSVDALTSTEDIGYAMSTTRFCLAMLILHMVVKVVTVYLSVMVLSTNNASWVLDLLQTGNPVGKSTTQDVEGGGRGNLLSAEQDDERAVSKEDEEDR